MQPWRSSYLTVTVRTGRQRVVITARGEVDDSSSPRLEELLASACVADRAVVLDLEAVTFVNGTGAQTISRFIAAVRARDSFCALRASDAVHRVLDAISVQ